MREAAKVVITRIILFFVFISCFIYSISILADRNNLINQIVNKKKKSEDLSQNQCKSLQSLLQGKINFIGFGFKTSIISNVLDAAFNHNLAKEIIAIAAFVTFCFEVTSEVNQLALYYDMYDFNW